MLYNELEGFIVGTIRIPLECLDMKDNKEKSIKIELDSFLVSVCKDKNLQPFSNTFRFEGENPAQNKLGEIFGVISSKDHSEESAYLPNLLSQVAKREFFLKPNRGTEESFEAALNKVNLALADLAEHDVTNWINNLDAVIGVINENDFHFTKLGDGQILLSKNKKVVNISDGLNEDKNVHPVKTFSDISSGTLSIDDKIIFSTKELFKSLSQEEINRHTKTFTSNEFDNILKSTVDLEGEDVGVVIVNIKKKSVMPIKEEKDIKNLNFFGESELFSARSSLGKRCHSLKNKEVEDEKVEIEITENKPIIAPISSLIPKKTQGGEIYLSKKEPGEKVIKKPVESFPISPFEESRELFIKETDKDEYKPQIEKVDNETEKKFNSVLDKVKQTLDELKKNSPISPNSIPLISKFKTDKTDENIRGMSFANGVSYLTEPSEEAYKKEELENEKQRIRKEKSDLRLKNEIIREKEEQNFKRIQKNLESSANKLKLILNSVNFPEKFKRAKRLLFKTIIKIKDFYIIIYEKTNQFFSNNKRKLTFSSKNKFSPAVSKASLKNEGIESNKNPLKYFTKFLGHSFIKKFGGALQFKKILKLQKLILKFTKENKKVVLIGIISFLIVISFFSFLFRERVPEEIVNTNKQETEVQRATLGNQLETTTIANLESEIQSITGDKDELFIYTTSEKFFKLNITNNELTEIALGEDVRGIKYLVSMPTLRLIFLISEENVFSYSPVVDRLTSVDIKLPTNLEIGGVGVYLQYLYLLDKNSNNIYQFPRKPGGFNNYRIRIADQQSFSTSIDLAVGDSILVALENGEVQQYFEGKLKNTFSTKPEKAKDIKIVDIETVADPDNVYALDSENGIISRISQENPTETERFFNQNFTEAEHLWINEKQDRIFVVTKNGDVLRASF